MNKCGDKHENTEQRHENWKKKRGEKKEQQVINDEKSVCMSVDFLICVCVCVFLCACD